MLKNSISEFIHPQVEECEVYLYLEGDLYHSFLCTPEALEELAVGHLFCRNEIQSEQQIKQLNIERLEKNGHEFHNIHVDLNREKRTIPATGSLPEELSVEDLKGFADRIKNSAAKYLNHGGIHCAAMADGEKILAIYEDVGRHNAFDKAIGAVVRKNISPAGLIYFSSGRINSEIAEKAAVCKLPLLVSRSIATTRACDILSKGNVEIIGRIESSSPLFYLLDATSA